MGYTSKSYRKFIAGSVTGALVHSAVSNGGDSVKKGRDLIEELFGEDVELSLLLSEEIDGVKLISDELDYNSGWYNYSIATIEYKGKRYKFEYREHTSDNVSDTDYYDDSFEETAVTVDATLTMKEYKLIRGLLETGYYMAKDEGREDEMEAIANLERKFIGLIK